MTNTFPQNYCTSSDTGLYQPEFIQKMMDNYCSSEYAILQVTISSLGEEYKEYKAKKPIQIVIKLEDGEFSAKYAPLGISEYSENLNTVIQDVKDYLVYLFDELTATNDANLTPELISQKKHLKQIISKKAITIN